MQIDMIQPPARPKRHKPYDLSKFRVLIVEDYPFIADLLSSALSQMGIGSTLIAHTVDAAKEHILSANAVSSLQNIDAIVLDWILLDGTAIDLLHWIRSHRRDSIKFMPVILCSANTSQSLVTQARDAGITEAMVKPVSAEKLANRILHVIDHLRPFIQTPDFFGPDRRRKIEKYTGSDRRITKKEDIAEEHEKLP